MLRLGCGFCQAGNGSARTDRDVPTPSSEQSQGTMRDCLLLHTYIASQEIFKKWCQSQDIVEVIGQYVVFDRRGVGACPFKEHPAHGSKRLSFQVFGGDSPHWYCYTWQRAGNVFDFLCLYHGLSCTRGLATDTSGSLVLARKRGRYGCVICVP